MTVDIEKMKEYIRDLRNERHRLLTTRRGFEQEYKQKCAEIDAALKRLQQRCPHVDTEYHPDPSGNNDSSYSCNICGKEAKRL